MITLALAVAAYQFVVPLYAAHRGDTRLMRAASSSAVMQFLLLCLSFAALTWAYVVSDFSVQNVFENSHSLKPMLYKVSGVWGNHEGSLLLWALILALWIFAVALFSKSLPTVFRARVLAIMGWIAAWR